MYWEQIGAMQVNHLIQKIKPGVRQGCVLFPDLFYIYNEIIMQNLEGYPGIKIGGHNEKT